jgi:SWI/SNF-related matrix-associated actin-dependent regulator 1 of chromatin subfamily A
VEFCKLWSLASLELTEPVPGLFVLACEFEDRFVAKKAAFRWHPGDRCRRKPCKACEHGLGRVWMTSDVLGASALVEYADDVLRGDILRRAAPAAEAREKAERRAALDAKAQKLRRVTSLRASKARDAKIDVPSPPGFEYLPFQRAAVAYALSRNNTLLADEMGLGKTIEALGVINADPSARKILIVCPASLKLNWARECERWLVEERRIGVAGKTFPADAEVVIVNYAMLGKWAAELGGDWDVLVADECHYVKNKDAKRSKHLYAIRAKRKLLLTGTPILNRPVELQPIAGLLDPDTFGHFWRFAKRYCNPQRNRFGWDFSGASNLSELHETLRSTIMVRRTKAEVLSELPPKRRQVIELPSDALADLVRVEERAWAEHERRLARLRVRSGEARAGGAGATEQELRELREGVHVAFGELSKLRHATALAKVPLIVDHVKNALLASGKLVVFAHHRDVVHEIAAAFGEAAVTLTGDDTVAQRQAAVDRFQGDADCTLFVGSIRAAGLGLTLTASAYVVFAELDWVPANLTQAEDRTHRIGQRDSVLVQHLVLQNSLDARMVRTLIRKQRIIDETLDGDHGQDLFESDLAADLIEAACARDGDP